MANYKDLSPDLVKALIATEDIRFAEHSGIDAQGLFRAIVKRGILMQKSGGGGSTITQQLAKQLFSPSADNMMERLFQKPIEWVIAVQLVICLRWNNWRTRLINMLPKLSPRTERRL